MSQPGNSSRVIYWILGALFSLLLLLSGVILNDVQRRISVAEELLRSDTERITTLEAHYKTILERQISIEKKLDRLIEEQIRMAASGK